jgi:tripartite-type tricarboxylate transporter receptor subunit TctC
VSEQLANQGADSVGTAPAEFAQIMRADMAKYAKIIREAKISIE